MVDFKNKTIGIWGYGIVGKSAAKFLSSLGATIIIYDDKPIESPQFPIASKEALLGKTDYILPSPGVDTAPVRTSYQGIWLNELDIFQHYCKKPVIAVTGSVGKTSVVEGITYALKAGGKKAIAAGNIGTAMLDIIPIQENFDYIVLEVSSFQLEFCQLFAPRIALITNIHPNHLDRHGSLATYQDAKFNIARYQKKSGITLLPTNLINETPLLKSCIFYIGSMTDSHASTIHFDDGNIVLDNNQQKNILAMRNTVKTSFADNELFIVSVLHFLNVAIQPMVIPALEHRLEKVGTIRGITFYNDSKSTSPASTLAALSNFSEKACALFLGGLSKGVNRETLIGELQHKPITVYCFGKEAHTLADWCKKYNVPHYTHQSLDESFQSCIAHMNNYEIILFSPSGSSFDLFADYKHRGQHFKTLVYDLLHK